MGRRKIEMQMVQDSSSRQVTFSKRRTGLFKKANELATLCGAEVAVVVFSPGGKPFSFGQPNVESIADRFLNEEDEEEDPNPSDCFVGSCSSKDEGGERLNQELGDVLKQLEAEKKRGESLDRALKRGKGPMGLKNKAAIGEINLPELQKLKGSLEELHENVKARASDMEASSSLLLLSNQPVRKAKAVAKSG